MLMDPHRAAVDHLHIAIVGLADGGHHAIPNPGFAPADKAVVAGGIGTEFLLRQSPPWCARPQHPENPVQHPPVVHPRHPRGLFGSNGAMTPHSKSVSSYPCMIQLPQLGSLNHISIPVAIIFMRSWPNRLLA